MAEISNMISGEGNETLCSQLEIGTHRQITVDSEQAIPLSPLSASHSEDFSRLVAEADDENASPGNTTGDLHISIPWDSRYGSIALLEPWFPAVNPKHVRAKNFTNWSNKRKTLLWTAFTTSFLTFLVCLVSLLVLRSKPEEFPEEDGIIMLFEGDCGKSKRSNTAFHVTINIFSSLLLGASNLCMQLLVAPTREEVDKAHKKQKWLDVGIPSLHNLKHINRKRVVIWLLLGVTSIPLHFISNSVISASIPQYEYTASVVSESFLRGASWNNYMDVFRRHPSPIQLSPGDWNNGSYLFHLKYYVSQMQSRVINDPKFFDNITKRECLRRYTNIFGDNGHVLVVVEDDPNAANDTLLYFANFRAKYGHNYMYRMQTWLCAGSGVLAGDREVEGTPIKEGANCLHQESIPDSMVDQWQKFNRRVKYCLSRAEKPGDHCRLYYVSSIMIAICCLSGAKCLGIFLTLCFHRSQTLCSIGDAVASFLKKPDPLTKKMGIVTQRMFLDRKWWGRKLPRKNSPWFFEEPSYYTWGPPKLVRRYQAATTRHWIFTLAIILAAFILAIYQFVTALGFVKQCINSSKFTDLLLEFGSVSSLALNFQGWSHRGKSGLICNVIYANIWQMIISFLYIGYNSLLTCMTVAEEWSGYSEERKTLRVTHPRGIQRSTYWVSMPMKYGIPLMAANSTLHWLISQSMFLVNVTVFDFTLSGEVRGNSTYFANGYNLYGAFVALLFGTCMVVIYLLNVMRPISPRIPLVSSCSAAISASCHRPPEDEDAHLLPVQWGLLDKTSNHSPRYAFTTFRDVGPDPMWDHPEAETQVQSRRSRLKTRAASWRESFSMRSPRSKGRANGEIVNAIAPATEVEEPATTSDDYPNKAN